MPEPRPGHDIAPLVLRLGLGAVLLALGMDKWGDPSAWIMYVPHAVAARIAAGGHFTVDALLRLLAFIEMLLGLQLALGLLTRRAATATALLLTAVVASIGLTPIGIRDLGLLSAAVALRSVGPGSLSVDRWWEERRERFSGIVRLLPEATWATVLTLAVLHTALFSPPSEAAIYVPTAVEPGYQHLPIPPIPQQVDVDPDWVLLGGLLFNDPRLSSDNTISCATCHSSAQAGADGRVVSIGVGGSLTQRNSPTVLNSGFNFRQFWDGRARTLEEQVDGPLTSPAEMGSTWEDVMAKLESDARYVRMFTTAFPDGLTRHNVRLAIAEFERSLITPDSPFDRYLRGDDDALDDQQRDGYELFVSLGCVACHHGVNAGGTLFQTIGKMLPYQDENGDEVDLGRYDLTADPRDRHRFKVPSLRNVALTAPYFHDGSVGTLDEAVRVMARYQLGYDLPEEDNAAIVAFLESLTGEIPEI